MLHGETYLFVNAAMSACALPLGGKLAGLSAPGRNRLLLSSALCAAFYLPALKAPHLTPLALMGLPVSVALCWGRMGIASCLRCGVTTLCASLMTGGSASALMAAGWAPSAALLGASLLSMLLYALAALLPSALCEVRQVELRVGERRVLLPAILDTGNLLRDPVTSLPVLLVPQRGVRSLFPDVRDLNALTGLPLGFRLLRVRTAAGGGLMPMFRPDECTLYLNGHTRAAELLVAVAGKEYGGIQALVPLAAVTNARGAE